jgi:hypothetical protein
MLDHVIIFNERHLRRVLSSYVDYYHLTRTHFSLDKDCPHSRCVQPPRSGRVIAANSAGCTIATSASRPDRTNYCLPLVAPAAGTTRSANRRIDGV